MSHGLPFDWRMDPLTTLSGQKEEKIRLYLSSGRIFATSRETQLIERVEALSEASERSMLLLRTLMERMDRRGQEKGAEAAFQFLEETLYEAEAVLHYVLTGEEMRSAASEETPLPFPTVSEGNGTG